MSLAAEFLEYLHSHQREKLHLNEQIGHLCDFLEIREQNRVAAKITRLKPGYALDFEPRFTAKSKGKRK